jgi:hypothetical protein
MPIRSSFRRRSNAILASSILAAVSGLLPSPTWTRVDATAQAPAGLEQQLESLRAALDRYYEDHGWYPADPEKDYNSDGRVDLFVEQLTWFTRDDGKPSDHRDSEFRFGPYLRDFPAELSSRSGDIVLDQHQARALSRLRDDVAAGSGRGGLYYEARTGNVVANWGRGPRSCYARF